jgi:hypothetical protein
MNTNSVERKGSIISYKNFQNKIAPVATFIKIRHSVSQTGNSKEANAVCSTKNTAV